MALPWGPMKRVFSIGAIANKLKQILFQLSSRREGEEEELPQMMQLKLSWENGNPAAPKLITDLAAPASLVRPTGWLSVCLAGEEEDALPLVASSSVQHPRKAIRWQK